MIIKCLYCINRTHSALKMAFVVLIYLGTNALGKLWVMISVIWKQPTDELIRKSIQMSWQQLQARRGYRGIYIANFFLRVIRKFQHQKTLVWFSRWETISLQNANWRLSFVSTPVNAWNENKLGRGRQPSESLGWFEEALLCRYFYIPPQTGLGYTPTGISSHLQWEQSMKELIFGAFPPKLKSFKWYLDGELISSPQENITC